MTLRTCKRTIPTVRSHRNVGFKKFLMVSGCALALAAFAKFCAVEESIQYDQYAAKSEQTGPTRRKTKPAIEYRTRVQWNKDQDTKLAYDFFKKLFTIKVPMPSPITHPLDLYSCLLESKAAAMDARSEGQVFDEESYLWQRGCLTLQETLDLIKLNPGPEAMEALRRLLNDLKEYGPLAVLDNGGDKVLGSDQEAHDTMEEMIVCAKAMELSSVTSGASPLMTVVELTATNPDAMSILVEYLLENFGNLGEVAEYLTHHPPVDLQDIAKRNAVVDALRSSNERAEARRYSVLGPDLIARLDEIARFRRYYGGTQETERDRKRLNKAHLDTEIDRIERGNAPSFPTREGIPDYTQAVIRTMNGEGGTASCDSLPFQAKRLMGISKSASE